MFTSTFSSVLGAIILISILLPWFLIGVLAVLLVYVYAAAFYRASARELTVPFYDLDGFCRPDPTIFLFLLSVLVWLQNVSAFTKPKQY
jgi:hypothetical protein